MSRGTRIAAAVCCSTSFGLLLLQFPRSAKRREFLVDFATNAGLVFPFHLSEELLFLLTQLGGRLAVRRRVHHVRLNHLDGDRVAGFDIRRVWPADVLI